MSPATGTYLFAIGREGLRPPREAPLPGAGPPRLVADGSLTAVACDVRLAALEGLHEPGSLGRLAAVAQAHDRILAELAATAPILPLRLGTVLDGDGAVRRLLRRGARDLLAELDRLDGHAEWAVVVRLPDIPERSEHGDEPSPVTGRDYLERRRAALEARAKRWQRREGLAAAIHAALRALAVDSGHVDGAPADDAAPLLHGVYLLPREREPDLAGTVADLRAAHPGAVIEVTGPWPAYHFTSVDLSEDSEGSPR